MKAGAEYLGISERSLRSLVDNGRVRLVRLDLRRSLIDREDLDRLIISAKG